MAAPRDPPWVKSIMTEDILPRIFFNNSSNLALLEAMLTFKQNRLISTNTLLVKWNHFRNCLGSLESMCESLCYCKCSRLNRHSMEEYLAFAFCNPKDMWPSHIWNHWRSHQDGMQSVIWFVFRTLIANGWLWLLESFILPRSFTNLKFWIFLNIYSRSTGSNYTCLLSCFILRYDPSLDSINVYRKPTSTTARSLKY